MLYHRTKTHENRDHGVLCLPGAVGTGSRDFGPQLASEQLAESVNLVAVDPRGYGGSRPPARNFSPGMYAQDARDGLELMKRLGFERFSVMGWSDGASTALLLASSQETMSFIRSIILWGGNSFVSKEDLDIREQMRDISVWSSRMRDPLVEIYGRDELQVMWSQWTDAIIRVYEEGGEICSKEKLNSIRCPTLLLHGAKDSLLPDFHLVYLKQHLGRQCTYHVFPNGKHNIHFQYANEFNAMVVEFLKNK